MTIYLFIINLCGPNKLTALKAVYLRLLLTTKKVINDTFDAMVTLELDTIKL